MTDLTREMVFMAAAMTVGHVEEMKEHLERARALGATPADMEEILTMVRGERLKVTLERDKEAESLLRAESLDLPVMTGGSSCGCGSGNC